MESPARETFRGLILGLSIALVVLAGTALSNSGYGNATSAVKLGYTGLLVAALASAIASLTANFRLRNWAFGLSVVLAPIVLISQVSCCLD
jgi:hypothetical protein